MSENNGIVYGKKYREDMDIVDIAVAFRDDIKAAKKSGELPADLKLSVRTRRYSMGRAIDVCIQDGVPFRIMNPARVIADMQPRRVEELRHTSEARELEAKVQAMLDAYNFDGSRPQEDYYSHNFHGHVTWNHQLEAAERTEIEAEWVADTENRAQRASQEGLAATQEAPAVRPKLVLVK